MPVRTKKATQISIKKSPNRGLPQPATQHHVVAVFRHGCTGHYIRMPTYKFQEPRSRRHDQHFSLTPDVQVRKDIPVRPRHTPLPVWGKHSDVLTGLVQIKQHQTVAAPRAAHQHVVKKHIPHVFLLAFHASGHGRGETDGVCRPHAIGLSVPHVDGIPRAVEAEHLAAGLLQRE